jgi:hypothetical protein
MALVRRLLYGMPDDAAPQSGGVANANNSQVTLVDF